MAQIEGLMFVLSTQRKRCSSEEVLCKRTNSQTIIKPALKLPEML